MKEMIKFKIVGALAVLLVLLLALGGVAYAYGYTSDPQTGEIPSQIVEPQNVEFSLCP